MQTVEGRNELTYNTMNHAQKKMVFYGTPHIKVLSETSHDDMLIVIYEIANSGIKYVTGDKWDWEVGLQYVGNLGHLAQMYYLDDETRRAIIDALK